MTQKSNFRKLLKEKDIIPVPGTFNALVAKLIEAQGFDAVYCTGAGISTSLLGYPDIGLMSLSEMTRTVGYICSAVKLPVISDADTGFGNAINVMRAVWEFEKIGAAGIHIEDQVTPKRCGHVAGKEVISTEEMVGKIRAATSARANPNFIIIARTDAKSVEGLKGAVERAKRYRDAGADVIFPEALETPDEFSQFSKAIPDIPLLANMTEFGKTPYLSVDEFRQLGYKIVIFPVSTMRIAMKAVDEFLNDLKRKGSQRDSLPKMQTRKELYDLIGYSQFTAWENEFLPQGGLDPLSQT
jgi:methylisocitrate lyase